MSDENPEVLGPQTKREEPSKEASGSTPLHGSDQEDGSSSEPRESDEAGNEPRRSRLRSFLVWSAVSLGVTALLAVASIVGVYLWHARDLPGFETLADYDPLESTRIVTTDGELVGELFMERRTVAPLEEMPDHLRAAFIAAEDERFYEHEGLDYLGIARALIRNLQAREVREGASTITQQVVKTFLLTPERRFSRKFQEMILARRLEQNLSKDDILFLYLNQIYFGHGRYGVQEAARYYFGKDVGKLDLSESATLAALPRAPNLYSPRRHPHRAMNRRAYVLRRVVESGMVDEEVAKEASERPLELAPLPTRRIGEGYVEEVRRLLSSRLGSDLLLGGGLTVEVGMNPAMQAAAEEAVSANLREIDKRQGWRGPIHRLDAMAREAVTRRFEELVSIRRGRGLEGPYLLDISDIDRWERDEEVPPPVGLVSPAPGAVVAGMVTTVERRSAKVDLGGMLARLKLSDMRWARTFSPEEHTPAPSSVADVLGENDVVLVRIEALPDEREEESDGDDAEGGSRRPSLEAKLEQHPLVEGSLVAIDPSDRSVLAMVGGYDLERSHFNRATQARRQPGSAFKPFVYGAALETRRYTAGSIVLDAPEMFRDPWTGNTWSPRNYDGRFAGDMTLRDSLAVSKNLVAVRLTDTVGVDAVIDFARRCGIESDLPRFLPLALGAGDVTPLELTNAYTTLAAGGRLDEPVLVHRVLDGDGEELFRHVGRNEATVPAGVAYILNDLLTSVLTSGTGRSLDQLGRPTAGKTGTTDDRRDAWFVGYTPELVAGVWVGFDEPQPLGRAEYGGRAAGPAWLSFMREALRDVPPTAFEPPPTVQFVRIDPEKGLLAPPGSPGVYEPFLPDTAPNKAASSGTLSPIDFLLAEP